MPKARSILEGFRRVRNEAEDRVLANRRKETKQRPSAPKAGAHVLHETADSTGSLQTTASTPSTIATASNPHLRTAAGQDIWEAAEEQLRRDERKGKILEIYKEILGEELGITATADKSTIAESQLRKLLEAKRKDLEGRTSHLYSSKLKIILLAKDMLSSFSGISPPAAIAGVGVCLVLTLIVQASEQHAHLLTGLRVVTAAMCRVNAIDSVYRSDTQGVLLAEHSATFNEEFRSNMIQLCCLLLEYQARALCYVRKHRIVQVASDMFGNNGWDKLNSDITASESSLLSNTSIINGMVMHTAFTRQTSFINKIEHNINDLLQQWERSTFQADEIREKNRKKTEFLRHLYRACPYSERKDRNKERVEGTCEWFKSHRAFQEWESHGRLLWVSADPGCGKSVLARYLVDHVLPRTDRTVCYFFFKDDFHDQKSAATAVCALTRQVILQKPHLLEDSTLEKFDQDGDVLLHSFKDMWDLFIQIVSDQSAGEVVCVFDAVDECQQSDRHQLIQAMQQLKNIDHVKCLLTSRPYAHLLREFRELHSTTPIIHLSGEGETELEKIAEEITLVVKSRVESISNKWLLEEHESDYLLQHLIATPNRTYLWVELTIDVIENTPEFTRGNVRRAVTHLPKTVDEAYEKILNRSTDMEKARKLLHIVLGAIHPLSLPEVSVALAVNERQRDITEMTEEQEPPQRFRATVRDLCGLFIVIIDNKLYLLHQTAREFLIVSSLTPDGLYSLNDKSHNDAWKNSFPEFDSHLVLARACIYFLLLENQSNIKAYNLDELSSSREEGLSGFQDYATFQWTHHFRAIGDEVPANLKSAALILCDPKQDRYTLGWFFRILRATNSGLHDQTWSMEAFMLSQLHVLSYLGLGGLMQDAIQNGADVYEKDELGHSPLYYASYKGHLDIVSLLLSPHENTKLLLKDESSRDFATTSEALSALERERLSGTDSEADSGADSRADSETNAEADSRADSEADTGTGSEADSETESEADLKVDLAADLDALLGWKSIWETDDLIVGRRKPWYNQASAFREPLQIAVIRRHLAVIQAILEAGADLEMKDKWSRTVLQLAVENGNSFETCEILLKYGPEVNTRGSKGGSPLHWAVLGNDHRLVRLLLESGADREAKDDYGRTPLHNAAYRGSASLLRLLIPMGSIDNVLLGNRTLLSLAAEAGNMETAALLIDNGANLESHPENGWTPLCFACRTGKESVIEVLLRSGACINMRTSPEGLSPLGIAALRGLPGPVERLIAAGAICDTVDQYGQTPLELAFHCYNEMVVRVLHSRGATPVLRSIGEEVSLAALVAKQYDEIVFIRLMNGVDLGTLDETWLLLMAGRLLEYLRLRNRQHVFLDTFYVHSQKY